MAKLNPGDCAPSLGLPDQHETVIEMADFAGRKRLLFFYPKANTSG